MKNTYKTVFMQNGSKKKAEVILNFHCFKN